VGRFLAISTPRLRLVAASAALEAAACARDGSLEQQLGASAAPDWPPQFAAEALGYWREPLEREPGLVGWTVWYWIEFAGAEGRLVGYGGFVAPQRTERSRSGTRSSTRRRAEGSRRRLVERWSRGRAAMSA
jgi:hypothetical protein